MIKLATKTLSCISESIEADQGTKYRAHLKNVVPHIDDAYRDDSFPFRSHMGASSIGGTCERKIWYSFRWAKRSNFDSRILRLFNRGHLEEARFIAMLLTIGCKIYQQDKEGNQFRVTYADGHAGGSCDGVATGIPDLDPGEPCLLEFKTINDSGFKKLVKGGVQKEKPDHYTQCQAYMHGMKINKCLYLCVNKNNDELHGEILTLDKDKAEDIIEKFERLVFTSIGPYKVSSKKSWWECKFCDYAGICHSQEPVEKNCRTCKNSTKALDGVWVCGITKTELDKHQQLAGCDKWDVLEILHDN